MDEGLFILEYINEVKRMFPQKTAILRYLSTNVLCGFMMWLLMVPT